MGDGLGVKWVGAGQGDRETKDALQVGKEVRVGTGRVSKGGREEQVLGGRRR